MLTKVPCNEEILQAIKDHCAGNGITLTDFSKRAGNVAIVTRLKGGKGILTSTYNRVVALINGESSDGKD